MTVVVDGYLVNYLNPPTWRMDRWSRKLMGSWQNGRMVTTSS